jgi:hypothetical protein
VRHLLAPTALIISDGADVGAFSMTRVVANAVPSLNVVHLAANDLGLACWRHTVTSGGRVETILGLPRVLIGSDAIGALWYRARTLPMSNFAQATASDRDYATSELMAIIVGWLGGLGPRVVNQPSGVCATGPGWSDARWLAEARRTGLPIARRTLSSSPRLARERASDAPTTSVTLTDGVGAGPLVARYATELQRLATTSGCRFLQLEFSCAAAPTLVRVDPVGELRNPQDVHAAAGLLLRMLGEHTRTPALEAAL